VLVQALVVRVALLFSLELRFYVAPDTGQGWRWLTPGSPLGSLVLMAATWLFGVYVQNFREQRSNLRLAGRGDGPAGVVLGLEGDSPVGGPVEQGNGRRSIALGGGKRSRQKRDRD
jgi:hypothetical protein